MKDQLLVTYHIGGQVTEWILDALDKAQKAGLET